MSLGGAREEKMEYNPLCATRGRCLRSHGICGMHTANIIQQDCRYKVAVGR